MKNATETLANKPSHWFWTLALLGLILYFGLLSQSCWYTHDDAYISFRYADNLVRGHGLVFNPGEHVEGYTNFLWTITIAAFMHFGADPVIVSKIMGGTFGLGILILTFVISGRIIGKYQIWNFIPIYLLTFSSTFLLWCVAGMESSAFTFFLLLGFYLWSSNGSKSWFFPISMAAAAMTRPEGSLFMMTLLVFSAIWNYSQGQKWSFIFRKTLLWIGIYLLFYAPFFLWRYSYYGYLFPNSYYVRMPYNISDYLAQFLQGLRYCLMFFLGNGALLYLLIPLAFFQIKEPTSKQIILHKQTELFFSAFMVLITIPYLAYVGGDSKPLYRLFYPVLPWLFILVAIGGYKAWEFFIKPAFQNFSRVAKIVFSGSALAAFLTALILVNLPLQAFVSAKLVMPFLLRPEPDTPSGSKGLKQYLDNQRTLGKWLQKHAPAETTIAVWAAGIVPFFSKLYTYDVLGVNDPIIAHHQAYEARKLDGEGASHVDILITAHQKEGLRSVLERSPDIVLTANEYPIFQEYGYSKMNFPNSYRIYWAKKEPVWQNLNQP